MASDDSETVTVTFNVHKEDHDGYCSGAEVKTTADYDTDEEVTISKENLRVNGYGKIDIKCLEHLNTTDCKCSGNSGYCGVQNYKRVTSAVMKKHESSDDDE